jgi:hypothetical protein
MTGQNARPRQLDQTGSLGPDGRISWWYGKTLASELELEHQLGPWVKALKFKRIRQLEAAQANCTLGSGRP